ncbi:MAG: hypothetical protein CMD15_01380 [Flavobacteriales bacterium]|nr:hypothetical protein [Flavobacteriales bacterium]|tara:strand:- start:23458 stop:23745 length:288 start_codon:yes stop_codon:yes gene_type:complete
MKIFIKTLFISILLFACNQNNNNWDLEDKKEFMKSCQIGIPNDLFSKDKQEAYCDCALNIYMQKYKNLEEANEAILGTNLKEIMNDIEPCVEQLQ